MGRGSAGIGILGTFMLVGNVDLAAVPASLTISSLLNDGQGDVLGLPLTLFGRTRNNAEIGVVPDRGWCGPERDGLDRVGGERRVSVSH